MGSQLKIRLAQRNDLASIERCADEAYEIYVARIGRKPAPMIADFASQIALGIVHVVEEDAQILGFVVFYPRDDHVHLENVAVRRCAQGRGLGARLIDHVELGALEHGASRVELYTNEKMRENVPYYLARGYVETGRRSEDGFDRIFFEKAL